MGDRSGSMQAFGTLPEAEALVSDSRPAWIWSADGSRIHWANAAGARRLGAQRPESLGQRRYPDSHPLRQDIQNAARLVGADGIFAGLRIVAQPRAVPVTCRVSRLAAEGFEGLLVIADGSGIGLSELASEGARSPIPQWLRARLQTHQPSNGKVAPRSPAAQAETAAATDMPPLADTVAGAGSASPRLATAALSPEEQAAFEEIALALGSAVDAAGPDPPRPHERQDGPDSPGASLRGRRSAIPSAFCGPAVSCAPTGEGYLRSRAGKAEARLAELTSILDIATDGVVILDADGRIESLNGSAEALFGVRQVEIAGRPFVELLAPDSRPVAARYFAEVKADGIAGLINEGRELAAEADGGTMPLFVTCGRIGGEKAGRFCAVLRDLTQWKQAERELVAARRRAEEASSQKSDFLARVSHEIRTPLNGIIGFADVIAEERFGPVSNPRYREYVRDIRTSGEHVLSLVNDLLDIAKIEAGKLELNFASVQLNQLVRECVMLMQPAAGRERIILRTSLAGDLPEIRADARTIRQVILNILSNAVKFTGAGGQVIVSSGCAEGGVVLKVRDTGEGMSEAELVRALEPFRQLGTAPLGDRTGTGLGLPLTKALVEANRASFAISSAKGEGTIVKVGFPSARMVADGR
jgi:PAS domain S-box-containing protein